MAEDRRSYMDEIQNAWSGSSPDIEQEKEHVQVSNPAHDFNANPERRVNWRVWGNGNLVVSNSKSQAAGSNPHSPQSFAKADFTSMTREAVGER